MTKSMICAEHDGIKHENVNGRRMYLVPCSKCGKIVKRRQYSSDKVYLCDYCKLSINEKQKQKDLQELMETKSKKEIMFDNAVIEMQKQIGDMNEYQSAIQTALTRVEMYGSIPEVMVAIELIRLKYSIIPQQKIGKYKVDFVLPNVNRVVEVDGAIYHTNSKEAYRDAYIKARLGYRWDVIHIPAELIRNHIQTLGKIISDSICNTSKKNI